MVGFCQGGNMPASHVCVSVTFFLNYLGKAGEKIILAGGKIILAGLVTT